MARYRTDDGTVVDTGLASAHWDEARDWDGHNHISRATGSQWNHATLYRSRKGRYYVEHISVEWVSREEAARWLLHNDHELPEDLAGLAEEVSE